ncbi:MAG TPA: hypothetical protein VEG08_02765, partial [Terriglobales bacterium]|nr:hypothetical protein [Terriglobales bacterium]
DTSEFQEVKARLAALSARRHLQVGKPGPTLMKRGKNEGSSGSDQPAQDDNRPTLQKRPPKDDPPSPESKPN